MSDGAIRARLDELGLTLHGPHPPHDPLDAVVVHDGVARTSGQLPRIAGELTCLGRLGDDVGVDEGRAAAAVCALNALAVLEVALGSLDRITRVLTVTGYVASAPDFHEQPTVVDGASACWPTSSGRRVGTRVPPSAWRRCRAAGPSRSR